MKTLDTLISRVSIVASFIVFLMVAIVAIEVISRFFGSPTSWVFDTVQLIWGVYIVFAGVYTLSLGQHIAINILYKRFNAKCKLIVNILDTVLFFMLYCALLWKGWEMAYKSILIRERLGTVLDPPIYPFKALIFVAVLLMLVEGLSQLLKYKKVV